MFSYFIKKLFFEFNKHNIDFCILRNYEGLPHKKNGRDIDFIVDIKNHSIIIKIIYNLEATMKFDILQIIDKYHLLTIRLGYYNKKMYVLTLDFFFYIGWQSLVLFSSTMILANCRKYNYFKIPSQTFEPLITVFHHYLWTGHLKKEKYKKQILYVLLENKLSSELSMYLQSVFGRDIEKVLMNSFQVEFGKISKKEKWNLRLSLMKFNVKTDFWGVVRRTGLLFVKEIIYSIKPDGKIFIINFKNKRYFLNESFYENIQTIDGKNCVFDKSKSINGIFSFFFFYITNYYFKIRRHTFIFLILSSKVYRKSILKKLTRFKIFRVNDDGNILLNVYKLMIKQ